ncbi:MAG: ADP-forming succinate--CoA ligase subunit beta [Planctomycetota bacterium]|nr:ADP-forming succinate--CoA ligase subunit beta [Planctomycetota bacterium]
MKIHEYQARQLLSDAGIPVPSGNMVETVDAAVAETGRILAAGETLVVVKAQVHAGGRGKAGFVKLCRTVEEAREAASFMLGNRMVSVQTGPEGIEVKRLLVAAGVDIAQEYYLAVTLDRARGVNTLIASAEGGVEIETVAEENPEAILKTPIHPLTGLEAFEARGVAKRLGFTGRQIGMAASIMQRLAKLYVDLDANLVEINPLVLTPPTEEAPEGRVMAIDAKFGFDDNALFRHKSLQAMHDPAEDNPAEARAEAAGLSYVDLDGNIGCLVNGAGLAMSTMDIVKLHGGDPANFLDVGGSATKESVTEAFRIILGDDRVQGVLVNIFGGIMKCDTIAGAIIEAAKEVGFEVPLVVRLEGTNVDAARRMLEDAKSEIPSMRTATDLDDAAKTVCAAVG